MGVHPLGIGMECGYQLVKGGVEVILFTEEDPVQGGQFARNVAGRDVAAHERDKPFAVLERVHEFVAADM